MPQFAKTTNVSVEKSRAEIEAVLQRYGATHFAYSVGPDRANIAFATHDRLVRFALPLPSRNDPRFHRTEKRGFRVQPDKAAANWEQACRQRWRALLLAIKAKLEAVDCGISTFEQEFLAFVVNPSTDRTIGDELTPLIEQRYADPNCPRPLLLPAPE